MLLRFRPITAAIGTAVYDVARQTAAHAANAGRWCFYAITTFLAGRKYDESLFALGRALYRRGIGDSATIERIKQLTLQIEGEQAFQSPSAKADAIAMRRRETHSLARTALAEKLPEAESIPETARAKQLWQAWNDDRVRRDRLLLDLRTTDRVQRRRLLLGYGFTLLVGWLVGRILINDGNERSLSHDQRFVAGASQPSDALSAGGASKGAPSAEPFSPKTSAVAPLPASSVKSDTSRPAMSDRVSAKPAASTVTGGKRDISPHPRSAPAEERPIRDVVEAPDIAGLIKQLNDSNPAVRRRAAMALGEIGPAARDAVEPLIRLFDDLDTCRVASIAVGSIGGEALPQLKIALSDPNRSVRYYAIGSLSFMGKEGVDLLIEALDDREESVASFAVSALGTIGPAAVPAVPRLIGRMLQHSDYSARESAAQALGRIGPQAKSAIEPILDAMRQDRNRSGNPWKYADALAGIGPEALPFLLAELPDDLTVGKSDPYMRAEAIRAISKMGNDGRPALPRLVKALSDPSESVALKAMSGLKTFEFRGEGTDPQALVVGLDSKNAQIREYTIEILVSGGHAAAVMPRLEQRIGDENSDVRLAAIRAMGILGQPAAASAARLRTVLANEKSSFVERLACATSLAQIVPDDCADAWAFVINSLDSRVLPWRVQALQSLPNFGDRVAAIRPRLLDLSTDSSDTVRTAAKAALDRLPKD